MALATTLQNYLADQKIAYEVITHRPTTTSSSTAEASHVSGDCVAKAVIVKDEDRFMMAVLPASHHLQLGELSRLCARPMGLATEEEASALFTDCELGAFPAFGAAYGLDMIVDDSLIDLSDVYFEGGDHASLVHLSAEQFYRLTENAVHGSFSAHD
jgi:Ala-tRNA(Pro) deacylase